MYINYNDYELLYLINEGNEKALDVLFNKYDHLIRMLAKEYVPYGNKSSDLAQEFRMILFKCIKCYHDYYRISFYSYFLISINRKAKRMMKNEYYSESLVLNEPNISFFDKSFKDETYILKTLFKIIEDKYYDNVSLDLIYECILGNCSLMKYASDNNLDYQKLYYKYKKLCNEIKEAMKKHTILDLDKSLL